MTLLTLAGCLYISRREVDDRVRPDERPPLDDSADADDSGSPCDVDLDGEESVSCGGLDCDDDNAAVNALAQEACNGVDDDCDGSTDEDGGTQEPSWHPDADGDSFGDAAAGIYACTRPDGFIEDDGDCDDGNAEVHPGVDEVCNAVDDDCDGGIDEEGAKGALTWYADTDDDGHGDEEATSVACEQPEGTTSTADDCDDLDPTVYMGAVEACDGLDNDCNTVIDDGVSCPCTVQHSTDAHAYLVCGAQKDWASAQSYCASYGYTLVTIGDLTENALLVSDVVDYRSSTWWIGINDRTTEGHYEWDDGSTYSYSNWYASTDDGAEADDCGTIELAARPGGQWDTEDCTKTADFICEAS